jgi:hypothetical protein
MQFEIKITSSEVAAPTISSIKSEDSGITICPNE